jgi:hypothetical protein
MTRAILPALCLVSAISCAHPDRVSNRALQGLTRNHQQYVLVFGSLTTPPGTLNHPAIRFMHQTDPSAPEYLLKTLAIARGDRFYAVLPAPPSASYLDAFTAEVGSAETGFDKITYVRLHERNVPLAMYVGEMVMSPAQDRAAQGQKVVVSTRDDFPNAEKELKRLYPGFDGTVEKVALLRNLRPPSTPLERIH